MVPSMTLRSWCPGGPQGGCCVLVTQRGGGWRVAGHHRGVGAAAWQRAAPVVRARVTCQGAEHVVVWRRGALALAHHDLAAEEALAAFGGEPPRCLEVVAAWRAGMVEPAPPPSVFFSPGPKGRAPVAHVFPQGGPPPLPEPLRRIRQLTLLLGRSLSWTQRGEVGARAYAPLASFRVPGRDLAVVGGVDGPSLGLVRGQHLLTLPVRWLTHVWARELEVVDGRFVADATRAPGADGRLRLVVLEWDRDAPSLVEQRLVPDGGTRR